MRPSIQYRPGVPKDALCVGVLATQVFLDTYATKGVSPELAREVLAGYSPKAFEARLEDPATSIVLALKNNHLAGFVEVVRDMPCPIHSVPHETELVRLYVQRGFQRQGIGRWLVRLAEDMAREAGDSGLWLAAWSGNDQALNFYSALQYSAVGNVQHVIEGQAYENIVFIKDVDVAAHQSEG